MKKHFYQLTKGIMMMTIALALAFLLVGEKGAKAEVDEEPISYTISGYWQLNDSISDIGERIHNVVFQTQDGKSWCGIKEFDDASIWYVQEDGTSVVVYDFMGSIADDYDVIYFGDESQSVTSVFWSWFNTVAHQTDESAFEYFGPVSGVWELNEVLTFPEKEIFQMVNYTYVHNGTLVSNKNMVVGRSYIVYNNNSGYTYAYNNGAWSISDCSYRTLDFGSEPQIVAKEFYLWLVANSGVTNEPEETYTLSGNWKFNDVLTVTEALPLETIEFISNGNKVGNILVDFYGTTLPSGVVRKTVEIGYGLVQENGTIMGLCAYTNSLGQYWLDPEYANVSFTKEQTVTKAFYEWFVANASEVVVDTTAPTYSNISVVEKTTNNYSVSILGAADAGNGLHTSAYCFIKVAIYGTVNEDNCSWQSSNVYNVTIVDDSKVYSYVRDLDGNVLSIDAVVLEFTAVNNNQIKGVWKFNDTITGQEIDETVNFTFQTIPSTGIVVESYDAGSHGSYWMLGYREWAYVYPDIKAEGSIFTPKVINADEWMSTANMTIDFGGKYQTVSATFYNWFTANATQVVSDEDIIGPNFDSVSLVKNYANNYTIAVNGAYDIDSGLDGAAYCFGSKFVTYVTCEKWQTSPTFTLDVTETTYNHVFIKDGLGNITYAAKVDLEYKKVYTLSGGWKFNDEITVDSNIAAAGGITQRINFTSYDFNLIGIELIYGGSYNNFINFISDDYGNYC